MLTISHRHHGESSDCSWLWHSCSTASSVIKNFPGKRLRSRSRFRSVGTGLAVGVEVDEWDGWDIVSFKERKEYFIEDGSDDFPSVVMMKLLSGRSFSFISTMLEGPFMFQCSCTALFRKCRDEVVTEVVLQQPQKGRFMPEDGSFSICIVTILAAY